MTTQEVVTFEINTDSENFFATYERNGEVQEAATFVIESIKTAKAKMLAMGVSDPQFVYAVCRRLAVMLGLELDTVIEILEAV